jgi:hypothetical protein
MLIHDKAAEYKRAIYPAPCEAWVCDDSKATEGARTARELGTKRLIYMFEVKR